MIGDGTQRLLLITAVRTYRIYYLPKFQIQLHRSTYVPMVSYLHWETASLSSGTIRYFLLRLSGEASPVLFKQLVQGLVSWAPYSCSWLVVGFSTNRKKKKDLTTEALERNNRNETWGETGNTKYNHCRLPQRTLAAGGEKAKRWILDLKILLWKWSFCDPSCERRNAYHSRSGCNATRFQHNIRITCLHYGLSDMSLRGLEKVDLDHDNDLTTHNIIILAAAAIEISSTITTSRRQWHHRSNSCREGRNTAAADSHRERN